MVTSSMEWKTKYVEKLISTEKAAELVKSGDRVVFTSGREAFSVGLALAVRKDVLGVAFAAMAVCWGILYSFGVFLKPLLEEFGWKRATAAGPAIVFHLIHGAFAVYLGRLVDRYGPRMIIQPLAF